ncbi:MAG: hypothetical protein WBP56_03780 [Polyangia bacterium]
MDTFDTYLLPGTFSQPTTLSRTLTFESTTFAQPQAFRVLPDLQKDLFVRFGAEDPTQHERGLSVASLLLLHAGIEDVRAGRVSAIPADCLEGGDEE